MPRDCAELTLPRLGLPPQGWLELATLDCSGLKTTLPRVSLAAHGALGGFDLAVVTAVGPSGTDTDRPVIQMLLADERAASQERGEAADPVVGFVKVKDSFEDADTGRWTLECVSTFSRKETVLLRSCVRAEFFGRALDGVVVVGGTVFWACWLSRGRLQTEGEV